MPDGSTCANDSALPRLKRPSELPNAYGIIAPVRTTVLPVTKMRIMSGFRLQASAFGLQPIQIFLPDVRHPLQQLVLRNARPGERIGIPYPIERRRGVVVGHAEQQDAAVPRLLWAGREQQPIRLELPQIGAMR